MRFTSKKRHSNDKNILYQRLSSFFDWTGSILLWLHMILKKNIKKRQSKCGVSCWVAAISMSIWNRVRHIFDIKRLDSVRQWMANGSESVITLHTIHFMHTIQKYSWCFHWQHCWPLHFKSSTHNRMCIRYYIAPVGCPNERGVKTVHKNCFTIDLQCWRRIEEIFGSHNRCSSESYKIQSLFYDDVVILTGEHIASVIVWTRLYRYSRAPHMQFHFMPHTVNVNWLAFLGKNMQKVKRVWLGFIISSCTPEIRQIEFPTQERIPLRCSKLEKISVPQHINPTSQKII